PHSIMHPPRFVKLTHARIHNRIAGLSPTPTFKLLFIIPPGDTVVFCFKALVGDLRKMIQDHHKEFPPDELIQPGLAMLAGQPDQLPHTVQTETEIYTYLAGACQCGYIPGFTVALEHFFKKLW